MTDPTPDIRREDFESLLDEHQRLIGLANQVEFHLHALAGGPNEGAIHALQQSAGSLVSLLRGYLFRLDQQLLPVLDHRSRPERSPGAGE